MGTRSEGSGARILRNTTVNGVGRLVNATLAIVLTPYLLHHLGPAQYGVWLLATTLTFSSGYLSLAELGLQQATVRFVAQARSRGDTNEVSKIVSTTVAIYALLGTALGIVLALLASTLADLFNVAPNLRMIATLVFLLIGLQIAVDLPAAGLLSLVEGAQRYGAMRVIDVGGRVAWGVAVIVAVSSGHGAVALAVLSLIAALISLAASFFAARRAQGGLRLSLRLVSWPVIRDIGTQSSALLALRVLGTIYTQMDRAVVGIALSAAVVARYEVAYKIQATAALALGVAQSAIVPAAAFLGARQHTERLRELFLRGTKYATALCTPIALAAILLARPLVVSWVGPQYRSLVGATRLFLIYPVLAVPLVIGQTMLVGLAKMREILWLNLLCVCVNLVMSIVLVHHLGMIGVIWGTILGYLLLWPPMTIVFFRHFKVSAGQWFGHVILPNLPGLAVETAVGAALLSVMGETHNLVVAGGAFALDCAVGIAVFATVGLNRGDRRQLLDVFVRRGPGPPEQASLS